MVFSKKYFFKKINHLSQYNKLGQSKIEFTYGIQTCSRLSPFQCPKIRLRGSWLVHDP